MNKITICGIEIYDELSINNRLATIDDFHINGKVKIGMKYYIKNRSGKFEEYKVNEYLKSKELSVYIKYSMVYIIESAL